MQSSPTSFLLRHRARSSHLQPQKVLSLANPPPSPFPEQQGDRRYRARRPSFVGIQ
ncbi:hypothetical protein B0T20DRAFT_94082 [Sordaria brevicollis]|uniref:Uncharacterized protein n=1 Tax=Sordaria brevicollis TaxID=83679 RepID=A0AAE0NX61_SORBR|nr:hypothetical protein B0T20DRAFT_94082 [Sordaria brevicollis]